MRISQVSILLPSVVLWFFPHRPNRFKIYHSLSWIVNSLMNQDSHFFGNNTHSVENKDIFFFSSKTI